jgi:hypothetical protein
MAKMIYKGSADGSFQKFELWKVNANQTIAEGSFVVLSNGKLNAAAATVAANSIVGVAVSGITTGSSVGDDDAILVDVNPNSLYEMDYAGSPVQGGAYDLSNSQTVNQADADPAAIKVVSAPDTANKRCVVKVMAGYHLYG